MSQGRAPLTPADREELRGILEHGSPTEAQREKIEAYLQHGSIRKAAAHIGISHQTIISAMDQVRRKAALQGWSPAHDMTHTAPDTHFVKGTSTLYSGDGEITQQWVKTNVKAEEKESQMRAFAEELAEFVRGKAPKVKMPRKGLTADMLALYPIGDQHHGMYSDAEETGDDYDITISEGLLVGAARRLVEWSPAADVAIVLNLGDFFHADNDAGVTMRSGALLDTDTRWQRVMRTGARALRGTIEAALGKHRKVIVRNNIGNHDDYSSLALALILESFYSKEPRVEIATSPNPFWYYQHGKVLLGTTHGDRIKVADLPGIMAHDQPQAWGESKFRYWHLGHFHHQRQHEAAGTVIEYHRTLAGKDAWTNRSGYRSGRDMRSIIYHREFGESDRHRVGVEQL